MIHMAMVKDVMYGKTMRKSYAKYEEILEIPNMLKIQKDSYQWFLETGLREVFKDVGTITDFSGKLELSFLDYTMEDKPKYTIEECKERDATYAKPIKVRVRLRNTETDEIKEQEIFMGDFPVMTNGGTFVINGAERVIISQIVRSPGMYYGHEVDKADQHTYTATVIPYRGAWLEYETDNANVFWVRIDKNRKLPITCLIRALGVQTDEQIKQMFGEDARILATIDKDPCKTREESLLEIYRRLRPGEPPTVETATAHLEGLLFDAHRYDVSTVGRYKFNKKMDIWSRLSGQEAAEPITDPMTGEILVMPGEFISRAQAHELSRKGVNEAVIKVGDTNVKVFSNNMVWMDAFVDFDPKEYGVREKVHFPVLKEMLETVPADGWKEAIADRMDDLIPKHIIVDDIMASINYLNCVAMGVGTPDDIDHLGNRRLRCVGELLQNQFRIGFSRLDRVIRERMTVQKDYEDTLVVEGGAAAGAEAAETVEPKGTITVAASPTPHAEILAEAAKILAKEGWTLEVTEFEDYVQPNLVVDSGEIDANYFQHTPYLDDFNEKKGTDLVAVAAIHYEPFGIYPGTKTALSDLADGDVIAVPNDTTNEARALLLLQDNGVIKLADGAGLAATVKDIVENPHNVKIQELEAAQVSRVKDEVAFVVLNGNYALQAGFSVAHDAVAYEASASAAAKTYANVLVVKAGNENNEGVQALVKVLKSDEIKQFINDTYDGAVIPFED